MRVVHLSLTDFRSYRQIDMDLSDGVSAFLGPNGEGKTNLLEAIGYVATQSSHRVSSDQPLVRDGAAQAVLRAGIVKGDRRAQIELELNPGRTNRALVNRASTRRPRDALGILRIVLFAPDDLRLVTGDPAERRRYLDDLLVARHPRFAAVRSDYEKVLRQRNSLLRSAGNGPRHRHHDGVVETLGVWDAQLARVGGELVAARLALVDDLHPHLQRHYGEMAADGSKAPEGNQVEAAYQASWELAPGGADRSRITASLLSALAERRDEELDRGVTLAGPHRDELRLSLGPFPARGYASHGESWSLALAMRLAAFELLRLDGDDPVLLLDDVFAELDERRRARLATLVGTAEQVLVTTAVDAALPADLVRHRFRVGSGSVRADD